MNKEAAEAMTRVQIAMWLPAKCIECGHAYTSVDDFQNRNVCCGGGKSTYIADKFVCEACWRPYIDALLEVDAYMRERNHD